MFVLTNIVNGAYWFFRGCECVGTTFAIAHDIRIIEEKDRRDLLLKDYVRVACQIGTAVLDIWVLHTDWHSSTLDKKIKMEDKDIEKLNTELNKNRVFSAQIQAMSLTTSLCHNVTNSYLIDTNTLYRMACLYAINSKLPAENQTGITSTLIKSTATAGVVGFSTKCFDRWYELNGPNAPVISLDTSYQDIPVRHQDNPVFSQYICPITHDPIRFPVTAPSVPGHPGYHFERKAIIDWLTTHNTNPITREPLRLNELRENLDMRREIENEIQRLRNLGIY